MPFAHAPSMSHIRGDDARIRPSTATHSASLHHPIRRGPCQPRLASDSRGPAAEPALYASKFQVVRNVWAAAWPDS
jgi:hypothetical protein